MNQMKMLALCAIMLSGILQANAAPVINGVSGPALLPKGASGAWAVSAYAPDAQYLQYSVQWGDGYVVPASASAGSFSHAYASAGNHTATFAVVDDKGASAQFQMTVQAYEIPAPACPGFTRLEQGNKISDGKYSLELDSVQVADHLALPHDAAAFTLFDGQARIGQYEVAKGGAFQSTMPNGDQIKVELCGISYDPYGSPYSSQFSRAYMRLLVNGNAATYGYQPYLEDTCQNDAQFTLIYVGGVVQSSSLQLRLSDVGVAIGAHNRHPAILDVLGASDNFTMPIMQATIEPYSLQPATLPWGKRVFITVCRTSPGPFLNSKFAEIKVVDEAGNAFAPPNQPPEINCISCPSSLLPLEAGTWEVRAGDPEGSLLTFGVDWGDGQKYQNIAPWPGEHNSCRFVHSYAQPGAYNITFTANDANGASTRLASAATVLGTMPSCNDSDGGFEIYLKGTSSGYWNEAGSLGYAEKTDYCLSASTLVEYYNQQACAIASWEEQCPGGCQDGACVQSDLPPAPPEDSEPVSQPASWASCAAEPATPGGPMGGGAVPVGVPASPAKPAEPAQPPLQDNRLDMIISLLEEIRQMLQQILDRI